MNIPEDHRPNLIETAGSLGIRNLWKLRGDLHVLRYHVMLSPTPDRAGLLRNIDMLMDISGELHDYLMQLQGSVRSTDFNKLARTMDAGGNAIQGFEELFRDRDTDLRTMLRNGFSVFLSYMADTAYINSAMEGCETLVSTYSMKVYDRFWALVQEFRTDTRPGEVEKIKKELEGFFSMLSDRTYSLPDRITLVAQLYQFLCLIYISAIMKKMV